MREKISICVNNSSQFKKVRDVFLSKNKIYIWLSNFQGFFNRVCEVHMFLFVWGGSLQNHLLLPNNWWSFTCFLVMFIQGTVRGWSKDQWRPLAILQSWPFWDGAFTWAELKGCLTWPPSIGDKEVTAWITWQWCLSSKWSLFQTHLNFFGKWMPRVIKKKYPWQIHWNGYIHLHLWLIFYGIN